MAYTYLLHHKPTNTYYYGAKWSKGSKPENFWKDYFTSSNKVQLLRTLFGDDTFEFEIRKIFESGKVCADWESKVLRRMGVLKNQDLWLNMTTNSAWLYDVHPKGMLGKKQTLKGLATCPAGWNKGMTGIYTEESKIKMGLGRKGKSPKNKGISGIVKMSDETRMKMSVSAKNRAQHA